jgi:hypothetical protein
LTGKVASGLLRFVITVHAAKLVPTLALLNSEAVRVGAPAEQDYLRLLDACEALAVAVGMPNVLAGGNMGRHEAYRHLVSRGFRTEILGVTMHRYNNPGYCRLGTYVIDDWR